MDFCWELVCYRLSGSDVGHVLQTCSVRRRLQERESLWQALLKRDFPEHAQNVKELWKECYQDLYQFGAYYLIAMNLIEIYPERPVACYVDTTHGGRAAVTYRQPRNDRWIRMPFESSLIRCMANEMDKVSRKKLLAGKSLPNRGTVHGNELVVVSTVASSAAPRDAFRFAREKLLPWIFQHFSVTKLAITKSRELRIHGKVEEWNKLECREKKLRVFETCGEGGGMGLKGPCGSPVSKSMVHKSHLSPFYGRCKEHPREYGDESIWETSVQTCESCVLFIIDGAELHAFKPVTRFVMRCTHMNGEPLSEILEFLDKI